MSPQTLGRWVKLQMKITKQTYFKCVKQDPKRNLILEVKMKNLQTELRLSGKYNLDGADNVLHEANLAMFTAGVGTHANLDNCHAS
jgi:hypothetical protein